MKIKNRLVGLMLAMALAAFSGGLAACTANEPEDSGSSSTSSDSSSSSPVVQNNYDAVGVYYAMNAQGGEYLLTLDTEDSFTLIFGTEMLTGDYLSDGSTIKLTATNNTEMNATVSDGVIVLGIDGEAYRFVKNNLYTVSYSVDGAVTSSVQVTNGKVAEKPADPEKSGYHFIGWYADDAYTTPFVFETTAISEDTTLYARFVEKVVGADEFTAKLVVDGELYAKQETISGKLYNLPTPEKEGATFVGWWLATEEGKLMQKYEEQELGANVYLYAVWESDAAILSVNATSISWTDTGVNNQYKLTVTTPNGDVEEFTVNGLYSKEYNFASKEAGEYKITLTKNGSIETTVYYENKVLDKVSIFSVAEPSVLLFNAVENAEKYIIDVDCGNDKHTHQQVDNGTSVYFNFANCDMQEGGIAFTVTAVGKDGYANSVSETFYYSRDLASVTGLTLNEETEVLTWNKVANATGYVVEIVKGEESYRVNVEKNECSLKNYAGELTIKVYPVSFGYNSPEAAELTYNKTRLASPVNVRYEEQSLVWTAVEGAEKYVVEINGESYETNEASLTLTEDFLVEGQDVYQVVVYALGANEATKSLASDAYMLRYATFDRNLVYANGYVSWSPVISAARYAVKLNDGNEISIGMETSYEVPFKKAGWNTISVCYYDADGKASDWIETQVYVYEIAFDVLGGTPVAKQYKAKGDTITLPEAEYLGYNFTGWYNVPGGPESNGAKYENATFDGVGNMTLYASWTPKAYTVTFYVNTEEGVLEEQTATVYYRQPFTLPTAASLDASMVFGGWYSEDRGGGEAYTDMEGFGEAWEYPEDRTLYASWLCVFSYVEATTADGVECYAVTKNDIAIDKVTSITIPSEYNGKPVLIIEANAFKGCSKLVKINVPDTIQTIYLDTTDTASSFLGCSGLQEVNVYCVDEENHAAHLMEGSAGVTAYESVDGILLTNKNGTKELKYIPSTIKSGTFEIPEGVQTIPQGVFSGKTFEEIIVPASVTRIETSAFASMTKLTNIVFKAAPEGVDEQALTISGSAFAGCTGLKEINLPARVQEFTNDIFSNCRYLEKINIEGKGVGANDTRVYTSVDGVLFSADKTKIILCPVRKSGEYRIPDTVTEIGDSAFDGCKYITKLTVSAQVAKIGSSAFNGCTSITELVFEADEYTTTALTIEDSAFYGCTGIKTLTLPRNLTKLGKYAFGGIYALKTVYVECGSNLDFANGAFATSTYNAVTYVTDLYFGANVGILEVNGVFGNALKNIVVDENNPNYTALEGVLFNKDVTKIVCYPAGREGDYVLPETVTEIGAGVFKGKTGIGQITIGKNVTLIGEEAFAKCTNLTKVIFEEGGTEALVIEAKAFSGCANLTNVTLPTRVKTISEYVFQGCTSFTEMVIPEGVEEMGDYVFISCTNLKTVSLPSTLLKMGTYNATTNALTDISVFDNCDSLESINVADANTAFADVEGVFYIRNADGVITELFLAPKMKSGVVDIPKTVTKIWNRAFYRNEKVTEIKFSEGIEGTLTIGTEVFYGAKGLTKVSLPTGLTAIAASMFSNCTALTSINIPYTVTTIGKQAFLNCAALSSVTFDATPTGTTAKTLTISDGSKDGEGAFAGCSALTSIELPERMTTVGNYTFSNNANLASVVLPSTLTKIGTSAFMNTALTEVVIGDKVTTLGKNAFSGCESLVSVTIGKAVKTLGDYEFSRCTNLSQVTFAEGCALTEISQGMFMHTAIESITIPAKVTKIDTSAFYKCTELQGVVIPASVTTINATAFQGCASLQNVTFDGTSKLTTLGQQAFRDCYALETITLPASIQTLNNQIFYNCRNLSTVNFALNTSGKSALKKLGNEVFIGSGLTSFTFPESSATLNDSALGTSLFKNCKKLETVHLSSSVSSIKEIFDDCYSIKKITVAENSSNFSIDENSPNLLLNAKNDDGVATAIRFIIGILPEDTLVVPDGIETIDDEAFYNQYLVTKVELPASVRSIGQNAFKYCDNLKEITFAEGSQLSELKKYAFAYSGIEKMTLPNSFTAFEGTYEFYHCENLASVVLPQNLTAIATYTFSECISLKSVVIPETVETIGASAFANCDSLSYVQLPAGLTVLNDSTFAYCTSLKSIQLPSGLTSIGRYTFRYSALESIVIPAGVTCMLASTATTEYCTFQECKSLKSVTFLGEVTAIGPKMFYNCTALTDFVMPSTVQHIGANAFYNTGLTKVNVPALQAKFTYTVNGATKTASSIGATIFSGCKALEEVTIADNAVLGATMFQNCTALKTLTIGDGVTLSASAFKGCKALTSVTLPEDLTALPNSVFQDCESLTTLEIPDTVASIGTSALSGTAITSVKIPTALTGLGTYSSSSAFSGMSQLSEVIFHDSLTIIGGSAFSNCTSLTNLVIPASVTTIGNTAFSGCTALESVTFAEGSALTTVYKGAFSGCSSLKTISLPEKATTLGDNLFQNCTSLESVTLPNGLVKIYQYMFNGCTSLKTLTLPENIETISTYAFDNSGLTSIVLPEKLESIGMYAFRNTQLSTIHIPAKVDTINNYAFSDNALLSSITVDEGNLKFLSDNGLLYTIDYALVCCPKNISGTVTLPEGATIKSYAFQNCDKITKIVLPADLEKIESYAFQGCTALTTIVIPDSVTSIGNYAFQGCTALRDLTIGEGVTSIGTYAFKQTTALKKVNLPSNLTTLSTSAFEASGLESIDIPASLKTIGSYAFRDCMSLAMLTLNEGLDKIDSSAFQNCYALTEVTIPESVTNIGASAFFMTGSSFEKDHHVSKLETVRILGNPTTIGSQAFAVSYYYSTTSNGNMYLPTSSLKNVYLSDTMTKLGEKMFMGVDTLETIEIPESVTTLGNYMFQGCTALTTVNIPKNVTTLPKYLFEYCESLKSVELPSELTTIQSYAFARSGIESIEIPEKIEILAESYSSATSCNSYIFYHCKNLSSVTFRGNVKVIGTYTFSGCSSLTEFTIPATVRTIGTSAFEGTGLTTLVVPDTVRELGSSIVKNCVNLTSCTLPSNYYITQLPSSTFDGCTSLTSFTIPDTMFDIGSYAFRNTALTSLVVPANIYQIGQQVFEGVKTLKSIVLPITVTSIKTDAFDGWTADQTIYFEGNELDMLEWVEGWCKDSEAKFVMNYKPAEEA